MRALVTAGVKDVAVQDVPVPPIASGEILVKVAAVAQNPIDPRHVDKGISPGRILGVDWAGIVVKLGEGVQGVQVGDRVAGFGYGSQSGDRGAFAEYLKAYADLVFRVPENISFEQAATVPTG
jgi:NADPH:quinone reductase-like Zn-dependent oxidoreductase